ncbi:MAG: hypothetical protein JO222_00335, partial [Frankiales bacterium]|nr:hypothetical protein [Frankiales bacterium]
GGALADSFGAGEALMWSSDPHIEGLLRSLGWAGQFPSAPGDFYDESEFEYIAKNGHELQRTFNHVVTLRPDGSGASETTMVLADTGAPEPGYNDDSLSYITPYGPKFCSQDPTSDKPDSGEQPLAGHPTAGYLRAAQPHGSMSLRVAFQCPALALPRTDGSFLYSLDFRDQPGHSGDILHLSVHLPQGFTWAGQPPPSTVRLYGEFRGAWEFHHSA